MGRSFPMHVFIAAKCGHWPAWWPWPASSDHMTTPAQTDTFSECFVPCWGITTHPSQASITASDTPLSSLPNTRASGPASGPGASCRGMAPSVCSTASTRYPSSCKRRTASKALGTCSHGTERVAPRAVFSISRCGGKGVKPHNSMPATPKASAVRNMEPTLWRLRTSSNRMRTGALAITLYVPASTLPNSSMVSLRSPAGMDRGENVRNAVRGGLVPHRGAAVPFGLAKVSGPWRRKGRREHR